MHHPPSSYDRSEKSKHYTYSLESKKEVVKEDFGSSVKTDNLADTFYL